MVKKMLIDTTHAEETRVVVVEGNKVDSFDFESLSKKQLSGNIYLAKVTRVEPSLQAAFVEYGGNRQGFLAFSEIHSDYYQIPAADREALLAEEMEERQRQAEQEEESIAHEEQVEPSEDEPSDVPNGMEVVANEEENTEEQDDYTNDLSVELSAETDASTEETVEEYPKRKRIKRYKIQEVIKKNQIILVQVTKEERGNKGAALTTYISLAGRYCVLMPNTPKGGGISRKITNISDRKRLRSMMQSFEIPQGMGLIVRTAGSNRTEQEIQRDYEYLLRQWDAVRNLTFQSIAPTIIYEEADLIKRSLRDVYDADIESIWIEGENGYKEASSYMRMLIPAHEKYVRLYKDKVPLFVRYQVENQLSNMFESTVQLKSGGYIVIDTTEALVAIDVNSGRSTKENSIEETALKTNLEAAEEVARQLRLRDMAGLIVIDFIDMEDNKNNRAVEKMLKDSLKADRARIQVGRISSFGLLEMSRQRLRPGILETITHSCPACKGTGIQRSNENIALSVLREIESVASTLRDSYVNKVELYCNVGIANYIINFKRSYLFDIEKRYSIQVFVIGDTSCLHQTDYKIETTKTEQSISNTPDDTVNAEAVYWSTEASQINTTDSSTCSEETDPEEKPKKRKRRPRKSRKPKTAETVNAEIPETQSDTPEAVDVGFDDGELGLDETTDDENPNKPARKRTRRPRRKSHSKNSTDSTSADDTAGTPVSETAVEAKVESSEPAVKIRAVEENPVAPSDTAEQEDQTTKKRGWWSKVLSS